MTNSIGQLPQEEILEKIKSGQVTMHSRLYLVWRATLWTLALTLLAAAGIFIVSFIIFALRASGVWDLPQFGPHGLREFLTYFPWLFVPAALLFVWLVERFVRRYSFVYRRPLFYSVFGVIVFTVAAGVAVFATPLHHALYQSARQRSLPIFGDIYEFLSILHPDDLYVGNVLSVSGPTSFLVQTREGYPVTVITNGSTTFYSLLPIKPQDDVEIIGEENNGVVTAFDVKKINKGSLYPLRQ